MIRGFNPPRPMQADCGLCGRLFAYFQRTKRRTYCNACSEIERQTANDFFNNQARLQRLEARENARMAHA